MNKCTAGKDTESVKKKKPKKNNNYPQTKSPGSDGFSGESTEHLKKINNTKSL